MQTVLQGTLRIQEHTTRYKALCRSEFEEGKNRRNETRVMDTYRDWDRGWVITCTLQHRTKRHQTMLKSTL